MRWPTRGSTRRWCAPPVNGAGRIVLVHGPQALRPRHFIATHSLLEPQLIRTNCALCEPTDAEKFPAAVGRSCCAIRSRTLQEAELGSPSSGHVAVSVRLPRSCRLRNSRATEPSAILRLTPWAVPVVLPVDPWLAPLVHTS